MNWKRNLAAVMLAITGAGLVGGTSAVTATQMPWRATVMDALWRISSRDDMAGTTAAKDLSNEDEVMVRARPGERPT